MGDGGRLFFTQRNKTELANSVGTNELAPHLSVSSVKSVVSHFFLFLTKYFQNITVKTRKDQKPEFTGSCRLLNTDRMIIQSEETVKKMEV